MMMCADIRRRIGRRYLERTIVQCRCGWMLTFTVSAQVDFPLECLVAETTLEGFVAGVLAHVRYQIAALGEGFTAYHALVRLLACNQKKIEMWG